MMKKVTCTIWLFLLLTCSAFAQMEDEGFINKPLRILLTQYPNMESIVIPKFEEAAKQNHFKNITTEILLGQPITYLSPQTKTHSSRNAELCITQTIYTPNSKNFVDYTLCLSMCISNLETYLDKFPSMKTKFIRELQNAFQSKGVNIPIENELLHYLISYIGLEPPPQTTNNSICNTVTWAKKFGDKPVYICVKSPITALLKSGLASCKLD